MNRRGQMKDIKRAGMTTDYESSQIQILCHSIDKETEMNERKKERIRPPEYCRNV